MSTEIKRWFNRFLEKPVTKIFKVYCILISIAAPFGLLFAFFGITAVHTGNWYVCPYVIMTFIFLLIFAIILGIGCVVGFQITKPYWITCIKSDIKDNLGLGDTDMKVILIKD